MVGEEQWKGDAMNGQLLKMEQAKVKGTSTARKYGFCGGCIVVIDGVERRWRETRGIRNDEKWSTPMKAEFYSA